jgi:MFS family permease
VKHDLIKPAPVGAAVARQPGKSGAVRAWMVFAISFGLLLSDYMSRQVLSAIFPLLKVEWSLSDAKLGVLGGAVALAVGLLTFPLSLLADRIGRARSVAVMALTWSIATLGCAMCANFGQLLAARLTLGVGEAAYGSVGLAVVFGYFPRSLRATITSAFMAGGVVGSFLGVALGGLIAARLGWRGAFEGMAAFGLTLTALYAITVRDRLTDNPHDGDGARPLRFSPRQVLGALLGDRIVVLTYLASGLQLFVLGALLSWLPSYLNRVVGLAPTRAAVLSAVLLLSAGAGMVVCGVLSDRLCARAPERRPGLAFAFALMTFVFLEAALALPSGAAQIACGLIGLFCAGGTTGPAGAIVADRTPPALHGASLAVLTLANNFLGLAPGPILTGLLADHFGLQSALKIGLVAAALSAVLFDVISRLRNDTRRSTARNGRRPIQGGKST